jgi:hypothetical protein
VRGRFLALLFCLAPPAGAADFYVDPVNGSDAGDLIETRNWESLP